MRILKFKSAFAIAVCFIIVSCGPKGRNKDSISVQTGDTTVKANSDGGKQVNNLAARKRSFEEKVYLNIDKVYAGPVYLNEKNQDVFYRILEIPEEENVMLCAENISIGSEGGDFKLIKRIRLTDTGSALPKYGLNQIDSLKFIDSVNVVGYFDQEKIKINLKENKKVQ